MVDPFISTPVVLEAAESPLAGHDHKGEFGNVTGGAKVNLTERFPLAICDVRAWPGAGAKTTGAIARVTGLALSESDDAVSDNAQAFQYAPGRWTVLATDPGLPEALADAIGGDGTAVDLSHGRTVLRIDGTASRHVLSKLFALDFAGASLAPGKGLATTHHEISAQIQRVGANGFDVIVFRSHARAFWHGLTRASEQVGYRVG